MSKVNLGVMFSVIIIFMGKKILSFDELDIPANRKMIDPVPGFYKVYIPDGFEVKIAEKTRAIPEFIKSNGQRVVNQQDKSFLADLWNKLQKYDAYADRLLYIGLGIDVNKRLYNYVRTMLHQGKNHNGGVYICQIENCNLLEVEWSYHNSDAVKTFLNTKKEDRKRGSEIYDLVWNELKAKETDMIQEYAQTHGGMRPFANRED